MVVLLLIFFGGESIFWNIKWLDLNNVYMLDNGINMKRIYRFCWFYNIVVCVGNLICVKGLMIFK